MLGLQAGEKHRIPPTTSRLGTRSPSLELGYSKARHKANDKAKAWAQDMASNNTKDKAMDKAKTKDDATTQLRDWQETRQHRA